jgi:hypothetical protein
MSDTFSIELPESVPRADAAEIAAELRNVDEVVATSSDTRALGEVLLLVQAVGGAFSAVSTAVPLVQKVVQLIRGKGVTGAKIELPNGTKLEVDSASVEDIERLLSAARS